MFVGLIAAMYVVLTLALAPISYGPVQFRVSELLKPLVLFNPILHNIIWYRNWYGKFVFPFGPGTILLWQLLDVIAAYMCWLLKWVCWL